MFPGLNTQFFQPAEVNKHGCALQRAPVDPLFGSLIRCCFVHFQRSINNFNCCSHASNKNGVRSRTDGIEMRLLNQIRKNTTPSVQNVTGSFGKHGDFSYTCQPCIFSSQCSCVRFSSKALQSVYNFLASVPGRRPKKLSNIAWDASGLLGFLQPFFFLLGLKILQFSMSLKQQFVPH